MKTFYATITRSQYPELCDRKKVLVGCVEIQNAIDSGDARDRIFEFLGNKWSFMYESLDKVHPLDRTVLLILP